MQGSQIFILFNAHNNVRFQDQHPREFSCQRDRSGSGQTGRNNMTKHVRWLFYICFYMILLYSYEMSEIKDKLKGVKDKVMGAGEDAKDTVTGRDTSGAGGTGSYEEGAPGTERGRKDDPLTSYKDKEPMTPSKIKEHEPTAVKREMSERITEPGQTRTSPEEA